MWGHVRATPANGSPFSRVPFPGISRFCSSQMSSKAHGCCSAIRGGVSLDRCQLSLALRTQADHRVMSEMCQRTKSLRSSPLRGPWRFLDAGQLSLTSSRRCRRPKTSTEADIRSCSMTSSARATAFAGRFRKASVACGPNMFDRSAVEPSGRRGRRACHTTVRAGRVARMVLRRASAEFCCTTCPPAVTIFTDRHQEFCATRFA